MNKLKKKSNRSLEENLEHNLFEYISGKNFTPISIPNLLNKLNIDPKHHELAKTILNRLATNLKIGIESDLITKVSKNNQIEGVISIHPRGFGFITAKNLELYPSDIFIPKPFINGAVEGDLVQCEITSTSSPKGPEGVVLAVVKRMNKEISGTVKGRITQQEYTIFSPLHGAQKQILMKVEGKIKLSIGTRVTLTVNKWGSDQDPIEGTLKEVIGDIEEAALDVKAALAEYHLPSTFSQAVIEQAKEYGSKISSKTLIDRNDLSDLETVTIDPTTAKDFDDALSIEKLDNGHYHLYVHIADVSHYVKKETPLDDEAFKRGNSTYFPTTCIPMLPEELSNELCSLKEKVKRLTVTVEMWIDPQGALQKYAIYRSVIKSDKRFTYEEAKQVLDKKKKSKHLPMLELMVELCQILKKVRASRGSIDLSLTSIEMQLDATGVPSHFERIEYDETHQMVEEFMLKANEIVAYHLVQEGKPAVFRVHDEPEKENLEDFYSLCRVLGFHLPKEPTVDHLAQLFQSAKNTPFAYQIATNFIRSMKLAFYSEQNVGHYGLALQHYCHFTSPIRRYTDLIVHRQLFEPDANQDLRFLSKHCSETERKSFKAENSVIILKKLRYLKKLLKQSPNETYPAFISKVKPFGFFFELESILFEGYVHVSELEDYYEYAPQQNALIGNHSKITLKSGHPFLVKIVSVDLIERVCKFEPIIKKKKK